MYQCECGFKLNHEPKRPFYCKCGRIDGADKKELPPPSWVSILRRLSKPTDRGAGDTVQRIASWFGGEAFKRFSAKIGMPCGCTTRQAEWNERWRW